MRELVMLSDGLKHQASRTFDAVVVVTESFIERERRRGFFNAVDPSIDISNQVGISYYGFHSKLVPNVGPGCILLLLGLEAMSESNKAKDKTIRSSHFRLRAGKVDQVVAMKELNVDQFQNFYDHPCTNELIQLSQRVKGSCLTRSPSCCWRNVADIHFPGLLSNVEALVVAFESFPRKDHAVATLSDKGHSIVLTDCLKYANSLQASHGDGKTVKITNLLSRITDLGDIVLVPTPNTNVTSVLTCKTPESLDENFINGASERKLQSKSSIIISNLESISFDSHNSVLDCKHSPSISSFVDAIVELKPSPSYRNATLTFRGGHVLKANQSIMKVLCASIDATHMLDHKQSRIAVFDLIHGLIKECTKLRIAVDNVNKKVLSLEIIQI
eukprot:CAMPEP_0178900344 /NCGR_PEP_ID=MMETSP0786-20121207/3424_1 /TAXON_ID=186022 /ORGANISM="Thalassionema frauenfeldii, Strain CCMP 1798" /LENGTH=386 /DNA_ID=CAMNT_0020571343 /DNA_START=159 /DNA_END=1319 /DNA_ORIENTATION=+